MTGEVASCPTSRRAELAADAVVHAIGITAAVVGAAALVVIAAINRDGLQLVTVTAYSVGLLAMLVCSTVYNMAERSRHRELLRRFDHAAIFVMIAGTYTPFTTLALPGGLGGCDDAVRLGRRGFRGGPEAVISVAALWQSVDRALSDLRLDRHGDALTTTQVEALASTEFSAFGTAQIAAFTTDQVAAFSTDVLNGAQLVAVRTR